MTTPSPEQPQNIQNFGQNQNAYASPSTSGGHSAMQNFDRRPHVGFGQAIKNNFKYLFHFSGRASRSEFWWAWGLWTLLFFGIVAGLIATILVAASSGPQMSDYSDYGLYLQEHRAHDESLNPLRIFVWASWAVSSLAYLLLTASVSWRRLQDAGFHGAFWLLNLVSLGIVPFVMYFFPSSPNGLKYDKPQDKNRP